jgi:hypothetical protein
MFGGIPLFNYEPTLVESDAPLPYLATHNELEITGKRRGKYFVAWAYTWSHASISSQFMSRVRLDNQYLIVPKGDGFHKQKPRSTSDVVPSFGFAVVDLKGRGQRIVLEFTTSELGDISRIHTSTLVAWRIG